MNFLKTIFFCLLLYLTGCSNKKDNSLIVGVSAEYPPFEFVKNGEIVGFDIDLMNLIASKLGKSVEYKDIRFSSLFPSLNSNQIDLAISAIAITQERKNTFDLSIPYFSDGIAVVYNKDNRINSIDDLNNKKIATQLGTTMEIWLKETFPNQEITLIDTNNQGIESLKNNIIDGVAVNISQAKTFILQNDHLDFFTIDDLNTKLFYGIMAQKNSNLISDINKVLEELINDGEIEKLKKRWII